MCIRQHYPCFSAALVTITLARPMPSTSSRRHVKKHAPQYEAVPSRSELPLSDNSDPTPCAWTGRYHGQPRFSSTHPTKHIPHIPCVKQILHRSERELWPKFKKDANAKPIRRLGSSRHRACVSSKNSLPSSGRGLWCIHPRTSIHCRCVSTPGELQPETRPRLRGCGCVGWLAVGKSQVHAEWADGGTGLGLWNASREKTSG